MTEEQVIKQLNEVLVECGIPNDAIFREMRVNLGRHRRLSVDLLVASEDPNLPLYVFEVKPSGLRKEVLRGACRAFDGISSILSCFVAVEEHGKVLVSRIRERGCSVWVDISTGRALLS